MGRTAFRRWFSVQRFWHGRLVHINVRHIALVLDYRTDVAGDLRRGCGLDARTVLKEAGLDYDDLAREGRELAERLYRGAKARQ